MPKWQQSEPQDQDHESNTSPKEMCCLMHLNSRIAVHGKVGRDDSSADEVMVAAVLTNGPCVYESASASSTRGVHSQLAKLERRPADPSKGLYCTGLNSCEPRLVGQITCKSLRYMIGKMRRVIGLNAVRPT